ncbi:MAG: hypothetical protein AAF236_12740 [Verrucomicrobiota bacterium]
MKHSQVHRDEDVAVQRVETDGVGSSRIPEILIEGVNEERVDRRAVDIEARRQITGRSHRGAIDDDRATGGRRYDLCVSRGRTEQQDQDEMPWSADLGDSKPQCHTAVVSFVRGGNQNRSRTLVKVLRKTEQSNLAGNVTNKAGSHLRHPTNTRA